MPRRPISIDILAQLAILPSPPAWIYTSQPNACIRTWLVAVQAARAIWFTQARWVIKADGSIPVHAGLGVGLGLGLGLGLTLALALAPHNRQHRDTKKN